jgi:hypothetical protein
VVSSNRGSGLTKINFEAGVQFARLLTIHVALTDTRDSCVDVG